MKNFFKECIHFGALPKSKKAITVRYLHIFINELHYQFNNTRSKEEEELLTRALLIIVLLHELTHYLFNISDLSSNWSTIDKDSNRKEGGQLMQEYIFGLYDINEITFEQAEAIVDINNWNLDNKNPIKDKFVPTKTSNNKNNNPSTISFMNSSSNGKQNWCGATF